MEGITMKRHKCPCCGHYTLPLDNYMDEICKVCFWQNDLVQNDDPNFEDGANEMNLKEARESYQKIGVISEEYKGYVRKPLECEKEENQLTKEMLESEFRYFATAEEIKKCFLEVEKKRKLKYAFVTWYDLKDIPTYNSITEIPNLEINTKGHPLGSRYLIMDDEYTFDAEQTSPNNYYLKKSSNPNAVSVTFNGFYKEIVLFGI